jgi:hypothetical protein
LQRARHIAETIHSGADCMHHLFYADRTPRADRAIMRCKKEVPHGSDAAHARLARRIETYRYGSTLDRCRPFDRFQSRRIRQDCGPANHAGRLRRSKASFAATDAAFMGIPILQVMFGPSSIYSALVLNLVASLLTIPLATMLLVLSVMTFSAAIYRVDGGLAAA